MRDFPYVIISLSLGLRHAPDSDQDNSVNARQHEQVAAAWGGRFLVQRNLRMAYFFEFVICIDVTLFSKDRIRIPWKASWPPTRHQQFGFPSRGSRAFVQRYSMSYHWRSMPRCTGPATFTSPPVGRQAPSQGGVQRHSRMALSGASKAKATGFVDHVGSPQLRVATCYGVALE